MGHATADRLNRLERILVSPDRWVEALLEVRTLDGELVLRVGGCWDRHQRRYVDRPCTPHVVTLQASQVEMGRALAEYVRARLNGDDARPVVLFAGGRRGGGKTWVLGGLAQVVIGLAVPGSWMIAVNVTAKQRREVVDAIGKIVPPKWLAAQVDDFRDPRTKFVTGSTIQWLSAKNPAAIRQAGLPIEAVFINEAQDQSITVYSNAIYAIRNTGGVVLIASNPPQTESGDWTAVLHQAIQAQEIDGLYLDLDANKNLAIHQPSLPKIAKALRAVDRFAAEADVDGVWRLSGDTAYPGFSPLSFDKGGHVGSPPQATPDSFGSSPEHGWEDVTREMTREPASSERGFDYIAGADFQKRPGLCSAIAKLFKTPEGKLVLWVCDYITTPGVEEDLSQAYITRGYYPGPVDLDGKPAPSLCIVGDATGQHQNAEHRRNLPYSFVRLKADGWTVLAPMRHFRTRSGMNPLVVDSRSQMHTLLTNGQILFSPRLLEPQPGFPSLIESFKRAKVKEGGKLDNRGHFQHGPDGVRYIAWKFMPRKKPPEPSYEPNMEIFKMFRDIKWGRDRDPFA